MVSAPSIVVKNRLASSACMYFGHDKGGRQLEATGGRPKQRFRKPSSYKFDWQIKTLGPPGYESFKAGVIWIPSRRCVQSDAPGGPIEIEADKIVRRRFLEVTNGGLDKNEMVYFMKPIRVVLKLFCAGRNDIFGL